MIETGLHSTYRWQPSRSRGTSSARRKKNSVVPYCTRCAGGMRCFSFWAVSRPYLLPVWLLLSSLALTSHYLICTLQYRWCTSCPRPGGRSWTSTATCCPRLAAPRVGLLGFLFVLNKQASLANVAPVALATSHDLGIVLTKMWNGIQGRFSAGVAESVVEWSSKQRLMCIVIVIHCFTVRLRAWLGRLWSEANSCGISSQLIHSCCMCHSLPCACRRG